MSREFASPWLANLIAARLPPEEFDRRARAPLTDAEAQDAAELLGWFMHRYPTVEARLAYARRKMRDLMRGCDAPSTSAEYRETARRLARAHHEADPETISVQLDPDPREREIRLVEVTHSAPTLGDPLAVSFMARPDLGVPYLCTLVLLSPEEWEDVEAGRLELPHPFSASRLVHP